MKLLILFLLAVNHGSIAEISEKPNVIIILADDLGYGDVGYSHYSQIPTPNIDALARDGIIFSRYYTQSLCSPSRGSLLTGLYPIHIGMERYVVRITEPWGLPLNFKLMPEYFRDLGYETHILGKWHIGMFKEEYLPTNRGFDSHVGYFGDAVDYFDHTNIKDNDRGLDMRLNKLAAASLDGSYMTDLIMERTEVIIKTRDPSKSLFLYIPHLAVHCGNDDKPLQPPVSSPPENFSYIKDNDRQLFAGMLTRLDESIGHLIKLLYEERMLDNTIILFLSDNGARPIGFKRNWGSNYPLRGSKGTLWEGGVHVPGFIWSRLLKKSGYVFNGLIHTSDWLPTLFYAVGGNSSELPPLAGENIWPALTYKLPSPRKEVLLNHDNDTGAYIQGKYKIIYGKQEYDDWYKPNGTGVPDGWIQLSKYISPVFYILHNRCHQRNKKCFPNNFTPVLESDKHKELMNFDKRILNRRHRKRIINRKHRKRILKRTRIFNRKRIPINRKIFSNALSRADMRWVENMERIKCSDKIERDCNPEKQVCLYDLFKDPCEKNDLSSQHPEIVELLKARLTEIIKTSLPPGNKDADPKALPKYNKGLWLNWKDPKEKQWDTVI